MIRIAHISDLHVLSRTAAEWRRIVFNKRLTGYANLILHRGRVHRREYLLAVLSAAAKQADHLVVTGDVELVGPHLRVARGRRTGGCGRRRRSRRHGHR